VVRPATGKSRLFQSSGDAAGECMLLEAYSVSHGKSYAFSRVALLVDFGIEEGNDKAERRERSEGSSLDPH